MPLSKRVIQQFDKNKPVAAEILDYKPGYRAWVAVYRISPYSITGRNHPSKQYIIRRVVVSLNYLQKFEDGLDLVYEHCDECEVTLVENEIELEHVLLRWIDSLNLLMPSWKVDYPF